MLRGVLVVRVIRGGFTGYYAWEEMGIYCCGLY
jgi:hypothetical protein